MKGFAAFLVLACACRTYDTVYTDDAGSQCVPPRLPCNGACVDPSSDRQNCGACGFACTTKQLCSKSSCVACPSSESACGTNGATFCTDLSTNSENCGACGFACSHGMACKLGKCLCPFTSCGEDCIDTTSDVNHCGSCNTVCPQAAPNELALCSQSQCSVTCIAPFKDCDGTGANGCEANLQTNNTNCGSCGRTCATGSCTSGLCDVTTYATGTALGALALTDSTIYFADRSTNGSILSAPIAGGSPTSVYPDNVVTVLGVDGTWLLWLHLNDQIEARPLAGGNATVLATTSGVLAMTCASGYVYYTNSGGTVARVPDDASSAPVTITSASTANSIAVDTTNVYFTNNGLVYFAPITGQNVTATPFDQTVNATTLAVDATHVYWATPTGSIIRKSKGGITVTTLASSESIATNIETDGVSIYWGTAFGEIHKLAVSGGAPSVIAKSQPGMLRVVAVDSERVYWASDKVVASTTK